MKQSLINRKGFLLLTLLVTMSSASAQKSFKYEAFLNKVDSTGFYKISFWPDVMVKSNDDLSDIRLMDQNGNYVPYVTAGNLPQIEKQKFIVFPQIPATPDTGTSFIVESKEKQPVSTLWLKLKNTAVVRTVNLSGSDDLKKWYAIEEGIPLQQAVLNSDGSYLQSLSFPASSYRYLKLLVNDKNKTPVKFLEAGVYVQKSNNIFYLPVPFNNILRKDSGKVTYITIPLNNYYLVNRLRLFISSPQYYKRAVSVYQIDKNEHQLICNTELNSGEQKDIFISTKTNKLQLQIINNDNVPLNFYKINIYQADQYIVSYLQKGKQYKLFTGDKGAKAPDYDLKFFIDSIHDIKEMTFGPLMKNGTYSSPATKKYNNAVIIWAALIVALLLLTFLTLKMVKEVNNKVVGK
jgi:Protein of unknown function (DUF3999)